MCRLLATRQTDTDIQNCVTIGQLFALDAPVFHNFTLSYATAFCSGFKAQSSYKGKLPLAVSNFSEHLLLLNCVAQI
jgi:hypothetical protein